MKFRLVTTNGAFGLAFACCALMAGQASAATIYADTVIEYYDSGSGQTYTSGFENNIASGRFCTTTSTGSCDPLTSVPVTYATSQYLHSFISLPTGSYVTLGFSSGFVFDNPGSNDIFIEEIGNGSEDAEVYISSDFGATFTLLGTAFGNTVTELDLATISYAGHVNAIKIVELDNGGSSPGFDLAYVQGLEGSATVVPLPAAIPLMASGLGMLGLLGWRRKRDATL